MRPSEERKEKKRENGRTGKIYSRIGLIDQPVYVCVYEYTGMCVGYGTIRYSMHTYLRS